MAWTTPKTWATGETVTAALLNTHLRDNLNALYNMENVLGAKVYRTSSQTINATSWEDLNFDNEEWDDDTIHDNSTNNERLTCKTAGRYAVIAHFQGSATLDYGAIYKNGSSYEIISSVAVQGSIGTCLIVIEMDLAVNDYITFRAYNPSGGGVDVTVTDGKPFFSMRKIG